MPRRYPPDPEESGFLEPPRRRPPTAVGTATPPPRRPHRPGDYRLFKSKTRIAAWAILAGAFGCVATASFATLTAWGIFIGATSLGTGVLLGIRVHHDVVIRRAVLQSRAKKRAA